MKIFVGFLLCVTLGFQNGYAQSEGTENASISQENAQAVTLELQGVSIIDVLKLISKKTGLNIVAGKNVEGNISLFMQNVPVREALQTILESHGFAFTEEGNVIRVMTMEDYQQKYGRPYQDRRVTRSFHLNYADAEKLSALLAQKKSAAGDLLIESRTNTVIITDFPEVMEEMELVIRESDLPQESRVFVLQYARVEDVEEKVKAFMEGSRGSYQIDKRSNRIFVRDIPAHMNAVEELIESFDVKLPQVLIQARIVEVQLSDNYRQGIDWTYVAEEAGSFDGISAAAPFLASAGGAGTLTTLTLGAGQDDLKLVMNALSRIGKTNTLSSPRLTVLNNEEAKLAVATREPVVSQSVVQSTNSATVADNIQFVDVGVTLEVTPMISKDQYVRLKIRPQVSSSGTPVELEGVSQGSDTTFTRTRIPVVTTQELETSVFVKSGTTIIIGGLIQDRQDKQTDKVPLLGSIPLLGKVFQSKSHAFVKTELVVFLTPVILRPDADTPEIKWFVDQEGELLPFNAFGGASYRLAYAEPVRHLKTGEMPYWERAFWRERNDGSHDEL